MYCQDKTKNKLILVLRKRTLNYKYKCADEMYPIFCLMLKILAFLVLTFSFFSTLLTTATKKPSKESPIPRLEKFDRDFQSQGSLDGTTERKDSDPIRILANPAVAEPLKHGMIIVVH